MRSTGGLCRLGIDLTDGRARTDRSAPPWRMSVDSSCAALDGRRRNVRTRADYCVLEGSTWAGPEPVKTSLLGLEWLQGGWWGDREACGRSRERPRTHRLDQCHAAAMLHARPQDITHATHATLRHAHPPQSQAGAPGPAIDACALSTPGLRGRTGGAYSVGRCRLPHTAEHARPPAWGNSHAMPRRPPCW